MAPHSFFERHARATVMVLVLVCVVATDAIFAALVALVDRRPAQGEPPAPPPLAIRSEVFHHGFRPYTRGTLAWGRRVYPFLTNSLGFVDREPRFVQLTTSLPRLVFLGDSFTEGKGVPYEKTFPGLVAAHWRRVSVLNAAALSYSPIIYYRKMKYFLEEIRLDCDEVAVFVDLSDVQDELFYRFDERGYVVWDAPRRDRELRANHDFGGEPEPMGPAAQFVADHTFAIRRGYELYRRLAGRDGSPTGRRRALWTLEPRLQDEFAREGLARAERHMDALHELLEGHGIHLLVAVYPWPDQIVRGDRDSLQVRFWRSWAARRGVELVDLFPRFLAGDPREALARYFIPGDVHWNEAGHALVAQALIEHYAACGIRPRRPPDASARTPRTPPDARR